jgi:hypothetical protein
MLFGPGSILDAHTDHERWQRDLEEAVKIHARDAKSARYPRPRVGSEHALVEHAPLHGDFLLNALETGEARAARTRPGRTVGGRRHGQGVLGSSDLAVVVQHSGVRERMGTNYRASVPRQGAAPRAAVHGEQGRVVPGHIGAAQRARQAGRRDHAALVRERQRVRRRETMVDSRAGQSCAQVRGACTYRSVIGGVPSPQTRGR